MVQPEFVKATADALECFYSDGDAFFQARAVLAWNHDYYWQEWAVFIHHYDGNSPDVYHHCWIQGEDETAAKRLIETFFNQFIQDSREGAAQ